MRAAPCVPNARRAMRPECAANRACQGSNLREYGNLDVVVRD
jgi:hypothetical protein